MRLAVSRLRNYRLEPGCYRTADRRHMQLADEFVDFLVSNDCGAAIERGTVMDDGQPLEPPRIYTDSVSRLSCRIDSQRSRPTRLNDSTLR